MGGASGAESRRHVDASKAAAACCMFIPHSIDRPVRPVPSPTTLIHTLQVRNQAGGGLLPPPSNDCALRASPAQRSQPLPTYLH